MKKAPVNGYEDWYTIRNHETDNRQQLTVPALLMLMQEASMHNARRLEISLWDQKMTNLSWVLLRKELNMVKMPSLGDKIKVVTYPAGFQKIFAYRDFWVFDEQGNLLATASSTWTLMNLVERKISKIPDHILTLATPDSDVCLSLPQVKLKISQELKKEYDYTIRYYDLDWNNHVNNIILAKLMIQSTDESYFSSRQMKKFTIHIKAECYLDDLLTIHMTSDENQCFYQISDQDNKPIAMSISEWI